MIGQTRVVTGVTVVESIDDLIRFLDVSKNATGPTIELAIAKSPMLGDWFVGVSVDGQHFVFSVDRARQMADAIEATQEGGADHLLAVNFRRMADQAEAAMATKQ